MLVSIRFQLFLSSTFVFINTAVVDTAILIQTLITQVKDLNATVKKLEKENVLLKLELAVYKNKKNSGNSHIPPSQDQNRPQKNKSLRTKSGKKSGGQSGHQGSTLTCSAAPDEVIDYQPGYCNNCGNDLSSVAATMIESRQVIDIPVIRTTCVEHRVYQKKCSCGHCMQSKFPGHVAASIQYGPVAQSLIGYLHARQYMPYKRMKEFFTDAFNLPMSEGSIANILQRFVKKALPHYDIIKQRIEAATYVGSDETSMVVNGAKHWTWTWQNSKFTFIACTDNRGFKTIEQYFTKGLPNCIIGHDRYAAHFNCKAKKHQICMAHLLRDLQYIIELYKNKCNWAVQMRDLIIQALMLKKVLSMPDYYGPNKKRNAIQKAMATLLQININEAHCKAKTLQKNLLKHQQHILTFLWYEDVPPDNNGSERAIRNIKVKQKISGQFKSENGANGFAVIRSIIDTAIKSGQNVLATLASIAKLGAE
jgi:transposase